ncbi:MAG: hypothetical protein SFV81_02145 [Pirellulaceae bacterium]|nr:hypothetical protein [Pirellulaceae bacterium]
MQRVIAVIDLPPRRSLPNVRMSFEAAADRWGAKVLWITKPLHPCHPFWQKMFVCDHVQSIFGSSHVLQLDNDMVIRSDCPSPFDLVAPIDFAMVSGRQSPQRRVDRASWNQMAHEEWARRCDVIAAPAWTHPNGGLYLYGTETFGTMFAEIISHLLPTGGKHDLGCDECLIVNQLWTYHRSAIRFLPADYNVNLHQNDCWLSNPVMQSYIYHFVARTKERLPEVRWKRADPVELPYPWDKRSRAIVDGWGNRPPDSFSLENITQVETAANLLTAYPNLKITVNDSMEFFAPCCSSISSHDRRGQFEATHTGYLNLLKLLLRLGPNAARIVVAGQG